MRGLCLVISPVTCGLHSSMCPITYGLHSPMGSIASEWHPAVGSITHGLHCPWDISPWGPLTCESLFIVCGR